MDESPLIDRSNIPAEPGIYKMFGESGIIYIGKAKNLRNRVSSYFKRDQATHTLKTQLMVKQIRRVEFIITQSEKDALILESQLIKKHQPRFNIMLKDDKHYPYIKITNELYPRIIIARKKDKTGTFFGPYPSMGSTRRLQQILIDLFPIRDCKQKIDNESMQPKCIKLDIGKCIGPCVIKSIKSDYDRYISELKSLLSGKNKPVLARLRSDMKVASDAQRYEQAAQIRDAIKKIHHISDAQLVDINDLASIHVWGYWETERTVYVMVQRLEDGKLMAQNGMFVDRDDVASPRDLIAQCWLQVYSDAESVPKKILVNDHWEPILQADPTLADLWVDRVVVPRRGKKRAILDGANRNAKFAALTVEKEQVSAPRLPYSELSKQIQSVLGLNAPPARIAGFDISHLGGTNIVSSCVVFESGKPLKADYRRFKIKTEIAVSDDPRSMYETVYRYLKRACDGDEVLPDLIMVDGGKPQLNFAMMALADLKLQKRVGCVSLAKKLEEFFLPSSSESIRLDRSDPVIKLFQHIRDEAHRFALRYQRAKRRDDFQKSALLEIPGVSTTRLNALFQHFKTIDTLRSASVHEIAKVGRIGEKLATKIQAHLNS